MKKIVTKKHPLFGKIRFIDGYPFLSDIATALNYRDFSYIELVDDHIFKMDIENTVVDDIGIKILLDKSNIEIPNLFKEWMFEFILPSIRKIKPIINPKNNILKTKSLNKTFYNHIKKIKDDKWITLPVHGFSNNYMYEYTESGKIVKSKAYKLWRQNFPFSCLSPLTSIDFNKPVQAYYIFDQVEKFDTPNMIKSLSDAITDYFEVDDHNIINQICLRGNIVNTIEEGQIHLYMYNI